MAKLPEFRFYDGDGRVVTTQAIEYYAGQQVLASPPYGGEFAVITALAAMTLGLDEKEIDEFKSTVNALLMTPYLTIEQAYDNLIRAAYQIRQKRDNGKV